MENDYLLQPISVKLTDRLPKTGFPCPALYCKPQLSLPLYFSGGEGQHLAMRHEHPPSKHSIGAAYEPLGMNQQQQRTEQCALLLSFLVFKSLNHIPRVPDEKFVILGQCFPFHSLPACIWSLQSLLCNHAGDLEVRFVSMQQHSLQSAQAAVSGS